MESDLDLAQLGSWLRTLHEVCCQGAQNRTLVPSL
jgi:hypothetical protein